MLNIELVCRSAHNSLTILNGWFKVLVIPHGIQTSLVKIVVAGRFNHLNIRGRSIRLNIEAHDNRIAAELTWIKSLKRRCHIRP